MKRLIPLTFLVALLPVCASGDEELQRILTFEGSHAGGLPEGWHGGPADTLAADDEIVHGGKWSGRIERDADSEGEFSALTHSFPVDFSGETLELRGFLRTEEVEGWAGLWLREDGEGGPVAFDNMQQRELRGTTGWTEHRIVLPLKKEALNVVFGALLTGNGRVWVDDLQFLVDGKPVWKAPRLERIVTAVDKDHEFDEGSGVDVTELSDGQIAHLARLGKVWGLLKYHHPAVTGGKVHWDYELFRVMPRVLGAADSSAANAAILAWAMGLGEVPACEPCAEAPQEIHLMPDVEWIGDREMLGADLAKYLQGVYHNRHAGGAQFFVGQHPGVGNPNFTNEPGYNGMEYPDAGYRMLGLFRFWNIIQYWFPYRDVMDEDWDAILSEFLPRLVAARDTEAYRLEMLALIGRVHDGHANLWRALDVRPPRGNCRLPVVLRYVEDHFVVTGYSLSNGWESGLKIGDVVLELDGSKVETMIAPWLPYYAASNDSTRMRDVARSLTRGACGPSVVRVTRGGEPSEVNADRVSVVETKLFESRRHDLPGETFRMLSSDIAYLTLSSVKGAEAAEYVRRAEGARGLIIDIRNYPSEFVVFALGQHLVAESTPFTRFTHGDLANPGAFLWTDPISLKPAPPRFEGKIVILVDESSMSQAEYTSMAFRSAPGAVVVGSTTAGADGNVSPIPLPGRVQTMISGIGVFYPDKTPTQRVGIVPDVETRPTIEGIREGRDEVLEEAVRQIVGDEIEEDVIRRMTTRYPAEAGDGALPE